MQTGMYILLLDIHHIGVSVFATASVLSLLLVIAKPLAKEFEAAALVWLRTLKKIQTEKHRLFDKKPLAPPQLDERSVKNAP
jgi:hypothetical protein